MNRIWPIVWLLAYFSTVMQPQRASKTKFSRIFSSRHEEPNIFFFKKADCWNNWSQCACARFLTKHSLRRIKIWFWRGVANDNFILSCKKDVFHETCQIPVKLTLFGRLKDMFFPFKMLSSEVVPCISLGLSSWLDNVLFVDLIVDTSLQSINRSLFAGTRPCRDLNEHSHHPFKPSVFCSVIRKYVT